MWLHIFERFAIVPDSYTSGDYTRRPDRTMAEGGMTEKGTAAPGRGAPRFKGGAIYCWVTVATFALPSWLMVAVWVTPLWSTYALLPWPPWVT